MTKAEKLLKRIQYSVAFLKLSYNRSSNLAQTLTKPNSAKKQTVHQRDGFVYNSWAEHLPQIPLFGQSHLIRFDRDLISRPFSKIIQMVAPISHLFYLICSTIWYYCNCQSISTYTQLRMCSLGAKEVAAVDSCFALVRARQHCIARH